MYVCMYGLVNLEIRGQFVGVSSFLPPCGSCGSDAGRQAWWQSPIEPSHWLFTGTSIREVLLFYICRKSIY